MGFTDIHSHILYGTDDGAKTLEESLAMLKLADAAGTTDIVATPHVTGQFEFDPELMDERIAELSARSTVRIHHGCDFHLEAENIEDALNNPGQVHDQQQRLSTRRVPRSQHLQEHRRDSQRSDRRRRPSRGARSDEQEVGKRSAWIRFSYTTRERS